MSRFLQVLAVTLTVALTFTFTSADKRGGVDVEEASRQLVDDIRHTANRAKSGNYVDKLRKDVLQLQAAASDLLVELPEKGSDCDGQLAIKMAAARTGSHEVLTVLLANDPMSVLNGRLSMSLALLEEVAHLMEDEVSLNDDVGPHLTAIIFGTNVTLDIIDTADEAVKALTTTDQKSAGGDGRVRRGYNLGSGFSVGGNGLQWTSSSGRYSFYGKPTFSPIGAQLGFTYRF
eukprot:TRINITY_DN1703_c1_g2_i1.p1 TRINITY_DN1703_c1_g2~~TRINITY_DN1703_c1_g2_i1.p1  ORF type:complete len:232 (+),score=47.02 TRINITY_DN1703_c1_g2_i1:133-828(+)